MAMGLAETRCVTLRHLMGRAALHQQGPNGVRHRFSPHHHDNVKVQRRDRTSPARLSGRPGNMDDLGKSSVDVINWKGAGGGISCGRRTHTETYTYTHTHTHTRRDVRQRKQPCCARCTGTCFYYYRSGGAGVRAVSCSMGKEVGEGGGWVGWGGVVGWLMMEGSCKMAAAAFDLLAPHCTVMRSDSVLTLLHLCSVPSLLLVLAHLRLCLAPPHTPTICGPSFLSLLVSHHQQVNKGWCTEGRGDRVTDGQGPLMEAKVKMGQSKCRAAVAQSGHHRTDLHPTSHLPGLRGSAAIMWFPDTLAFYFARSRFNLLLFSFFFHFFSWLLSIKAKEYPGISHFRLLDETEKTEGQD